METNIIIQCLRNANAAPLLFIFSSFRHIKQKQKLYNRNLNTNERENIAGTMNLYTLNNTEAKRALKIAKTIAVATSRVNVRNVIAKSSL